MAYSDVFMRNGVSIPNGVYVTSPAAFGTNEPRRLQLKDNIAHDSEYNIRDMFYNLPLALFTVEGLPNPVPDYEDVNNILAYGYEVDSASNIFSPTICFEIHGEAAFLDSVPLETSRGTDIISLDTEGYATPLQYFDIDTFLHELGQYNMGMENDWLGNELSDYGTVRFFQAYVTFTMQMNGVDCRRICSVGPEHQRESIPPSLTRPTLVADEDVLCE
jgi:hypothetical protein